MKKHLLPIVLACSISTTVVAQEGSTGVIGALDNLANSNLSINLGDDFTLGVEGSIVNNSTAGANSDQYNMKESYISIALEWNRKMRAVITGKIDRLFGDHTEGLSTSEKKRLSSEIENFVDEAYIEYSQVGGAPVAILIGKMPMAFGQRVEEMPIFTNNPLYNSQVIDQVFGLTVQIDKEFLGIFDQLEISIGESEHGDLSVGDIDTFSARLTKLIGPTLMATTSHTEMGNNHLATGKAKRTSLGLVYQNHSGKMVAWLEALILKNDTHLPNSDYAVTGGVRYNLTKKTFLIGEISYAKDSITQGGFGIRHELSSSLSLGAEMRYSDYQDGQEDGFSFGINLTYQFGNIRQVEEDDILNELDLEDIDLE